MDANMLQSMSTLGIIQKISTGHMLIDVCICMLLPLMLAHFKPYIDTVWAWLNKTTQTARFTRTIKYVKREGYYHFDPSESNQIMHEAVLLFIGSQPELTEKFKVRHARPLKHGSNIKHYADFKLCSCVRMSDIVSVPYCC